SDELLPDVSLELAEVVVAASYLGRPEVLEGRVVLPRHLAELLHGALVRSRESRLALREGRRRGDEMGVESDALFEVGRRRGHADTQVRLSIMLQHDIAGVLDLGGVVNERPAVIVGPADELLVVFDVRLHILEEARLLLERAVEHLTHHGAGPGLGRLVDRLSPLQLSVELSVARVRVIDPVSLVRREDPEYGREYRQDPGKHVVEPEWVPGEALPRESRGPPLIQVRRDARRRRIGAWRRHARLWLLRDVVGRQAIVRGRERHQRKACVEDGDTGQRERLTAPGGMVRDPKEAPGKEHT